MPIYEYRCQKCGHELEKLQRMSDAALTDCPECGKASLQRLISAAGFRLKGGGWYETDFKQGNKRNLAEGGNGKEASAPASNGSGSESKKDSGGEKSTPAAKAPAESGSSKSTGSTAGTT